MSVDDSEHTAGAGRGRVGDRAAPLTRVILASGLRLRLGYTAFFQRLGFGANSFLLPLSVLIGVVSAAAGVAFHELIVWIRELLYRRWVGHDYLYGHGAWLLVAFPALGGLLVGLFSTYVMRSREGHGVVDVMETVMRSSGLVRPIVAIEKILTAAVTIGTGGSAGAEGPIVQIGAGISSFFGEVFQVTRAQLPVLIGCGTAAGISAIFSAPFGGVLFTLEVILLDFSLRTFTPIVLSSVIAYVTTQGIFRALAPHESHRAIFDVSTAAGEPSLLNWAGVPNLVLLGLACGLAGVALTRLMYSSEEWWHRRQLPRAVRPAVGGAALGVLGVAYVVGFGWLMLGRAKPFDFENYPMPAFFGDGYGIVQQLIGGDVYARFPAGRLALLLLFLCVAKVVGTCLTLASGGSGGIIAPSLFLGATTGALLGLGLRAVGHPAGMGIGFYALIGMGAVLAAVVHAPLASILILFEVTRQGDVMLPAMLACVVATGTAQLLFRDSIYTLALRRRGVSIGSGGDLTLLRRLTIEQVDLEPVAAISVDAPLEQLLTLAEDSAVGDMVVVDRTGAYVGMATAEDVKTALIQREAIPLLTVAELVRPELPCVRSSDDFATALETFSRHEVGRLPVCLAHNPTRVIGLVSRRALMRRYHSALSGG